MTFTSYAQNFEDIMLWRALRHVDKGFYVDVGAADPTEDSVTRAFYERGWRGVNIEPVPAYFERLLAARPDDVNLNIVLGDAPGEARFFVVPGTGLSTLVPEVAEAARRNGWRIETTQVERSTLRDICARHAKSPIHFLKIDVEGAEHAVLAGADFKTHRPWIVLVESTFPTTQRATHAEWEPLLLAAGYRFVWFDGLSRFYVASERHAELAPHFVLPVNVFDDYVRFDPASEAKLELARSEARDLRAQLAASQEQARASEERLNETRQQLVSSEERLNAAREQLAATDGRLNEVRERLAAVYASHSWRVTSPLRAVATALRGPRQHRAERPDPPQRKIRTRRPTIFVECTHTYESDLNTGIQRVVRNIVRHAPSVAARYGYDVVPVILKEGTFVEVDDARVLANKEVEAAGPETAGQHVAWPHRQAGKGNAKRTTDQYDSQAGNILLLLDSSWTFDLWPAVSRFKQAGGYVAGVIYDLIPVTHSYTCVEPLVIAFKDWLRHHQKITDSLVAISRSTKEQVEAFFDADSANGAAGQVNDARIPVSFFHLGSELDFINPKIEPRASIRAIFSGPAPTFLVVGTIEPRKNHPYILDAFDQIWQAGQSAALVIVGKRDWKSEEFLARVAAHPQLGRLLHLLRDVSDAELDYAYRHATALVIASEIEGFGLPVVEAFQRGLPVLCSDIPVFRELASGRARFFGLDSPSNLARAVTEFMRESEQQPANRLPLPWLTWRDSAAQLLDTVLAQVKAKEEAGTLPSAS